MPDDDTPEATYARDVLLDELDAALDELPAEQRETFVAHELDHHHHHHEPFREPPGDTAGAPKP